MIKMKVNSTYDWRVRNWGLLSLEICLRGDFLILLKYIKGNFKGERNMLSIYNKVQDERKWD